MSGVVFSLRDTLFNKDASKALHAYTGLIYSHKRMSEAV